MFHTLSKDTISLQNCIDNQNKDLRVGLRSITYTVGWYNIGEGESFMWRQRENDETNSVDITPGLYGFKRLKEIIESVGGFGTLEVNKENGLVNLTVANGQIVHMTDGILSILGLPDRYWYNEGIYIGEHPVNFATKKLLYIYLDQINTNNNIVDGKPTNLLSCIGLDCPSFGSVITKTFEHPEYKLLQNGTINEWKVTIKDENGIELDNHGLPIYISIEIK